MRRVLARRGLDYAIVGAFHVGDDWRDGGDGDRMVVLLVLVFVEI